MRPGDAERRGGVSTRSAGLLQGQTWGEAFLGIACNARRFWPMSNDSSGRWSLGMPRPYDVMDNAREEYSQGGSHDKAGAG